MFVGLWESNSSIPEREREKERLLTTHVLLYSVVLHVVSYKDGCDIWIIQVYIVGRVAHSV